MNRPPPAIDPVKHRRRIPARRDPLRAVGLSAVVHHLVSQHGHVTATLHFQVQHFEAVDVDLAAKLYSRLARVQSGLVYAGSRARVDWADAAIEMGYADQSHMIAEFREFTGLTPQKLASHDWFHPFIERAKSGVW
jgi:AraC-like DNA-binding protein